MASKMFMTSNSESFLAGGDLSDKKNTFVKYGTTLGEVVAISAAADIPCGVLMNDPTEGQTAEVAMPGGGALLKVDSGITAGSFISTGADGKGEAATGTSGKFIGAIAEAISNSASSTDDVMPVVVTAFEAAREAQDIMTTRGDLIRGGVAGVPERVALGNAGQVFGRVGTDAAWTNTLNDAVLGGTTVTISANVDSSGKLDFQNNTTAGASPGHIIKGTAVAAGSYSGTHAGLIVKQYDADTTVVHNGGELAGLYVNLKQLSAMQAGGKSALISAHNYGSGGDYQVLDFGMRLFGDLVDGVELTGGTVTSAIKLDTTSALTNVLKLATGKGCAIGSDNMTKNPNSDTEDGYIVVDVGGTSYQMPVYAA